MHLKFILLLLLGALIGPCLSASAKTLDTKDIASAHLIALMPGTFDPVTNGHLAVAESAQRISKADLVIMIPNNAPKNKTPISIGDRLDLLAIGNSASSLIAQPDSGVLRENAVKGLSIGEWTALVRKYNSKAQIAFVLGDDVAKRDSTALGFQNEISSLRSNLHPQVLAEIERQQFYNSNQFREKTSCVEAF